MADAVDALDWIARPERFALAPTCVLAGRDGFLQRRALLALRQRVLGGEDADFSLTTFAGDDAQWRDVLAELSTVALFGGQRLVVVEDADEFVTRARAVLEDYVARPASGGVLALCVASWPASTRLAKAVAASGLTIRCDPPPSAKLAKWLVAWAKSEHQARLAPDAAEALVEMIEPELGLFDQQLAKLAALAGPEGTITAEMAQASAGTWRAKTTWDMLDAALAGQSARALVELDRLLLAGEVPIALLAQIGASLRRLAAATRLLALAEAAGRRLTLRGALEEVGVKPFVLAKSEGQLRQLGRRRAEQLNRWLLETDMALKGGSAAPARIVLEQLIARLAAPAAPAAAGPRPAPAAYGRPR